VHIPNRPPQERHRSGLQSDKKISGKIRFSQKHLKIAFVNQISGKIRFSQNIKKSLLGIIFISAQP
jgi:hypothetical protein